MGFVLDLFDGRCVNLSAIHPHLWSGCDSKERKKEKEASDSICLRKKVSKWEDNSSGCAAATVW